MPQANVYGLILEDVGGINLANYSPSMGDYSSLGNSLMAAVSTFPSHGVTHADIRSENILLSSPNRIVLIDFGHAILRGIGVTDEKWN